MNKEIRFSLSDLQHICRKYRKKILLTALLFGFLGMFHALTKPIQFTAQSTFREKGKSQVGLSSGLSSLLLSGASDKSNSESISTLKSHSFLKNLVKKMGFQGNLKKKGSDKTSKFSLIKDNLWIEYALFYGRISPFFQDKQSSIAVREITYSGEHPLVFRILFLPGDKFEVMRSRIDTPTSGTIGESVVYPDIRFTIIRNTPENISYQEYQLVVLPLPTVLEHFSKSIIVETDREDKTLLNFTYTNADRLLAAETLNNLMFEYEEHLKNEQQKISNKQLDYLQLRYDQMKDRLQTMMEQHAAILSSDVITMGFPDANTAINFFAVAQQQYIRELLNNDLELKRLQQMQSAGEDIYHKYTPENLSSPIASFIAQIRQLKRQGDTIELALKEPQQFIQANNLTNQFEQLSSLQKLSEETSQLIANIDLGIHNFDASNALLKEPQYMINTWVKKINDVQNNPQAKEQCLNQLRAYLANLSHLFSVQEQAIKERITHHRSTPEEFDGIDLNTARELYLSYSKELNIVEAEMLQKKFIIDQMKDPKFEMSSLCTVLVDPISQRMISQAGTILLNLQDQNNRSVKEQERLRGELEVEKGFLSSHLNQTIQLLQLREKLLKDKIRSLQNTTLSLTQQEISVLQKHLMDHIQTRIDNLKLERGIIESHQINLQQKMASLPNKWVAEKLIDQQMEMNSHLVEELTRMVESKNTTSNLEMIQSAPVDYAVAPVKPKPPKTLFFALFGAISGALLAITYFFLKSLFTGMPVTLENLRLSGFHTSGILSERYKAKQNRVLSDQDLNTLRHLAGFLTEHSQGHSNALLLTLHGPDYSVDLATLFSKKGLKVLLMPLSFDEAKENKLPGLLQYLEGKTEEPLIHAKGDYDILETGGITRYTNELIDQPRFHDLMENFKKQYDLVLATSNASLNSALAENLIKQFQYTVITITHETWDEIHQCKALTKESETQKFTFTKAFA